jgi:hypothetical protein
MPGDNGPQKGDGPQLDEEKIRDAIENAQPPPGTAGGAFEWPEPISLDNPVLPDLPTGKSVPWLDEMIRATATATETPPELAALMGLGAIAAAVQWKFIVQVHVGYVEPLNIWSCPALDSGNRKTPVLKAMTRPLLQWEREEAEAVNIQVDEAKSQRATAEAQIRELRNQAARTESADFERLSEQILQLEKELPEIPGVPRVWAQDVTSERLGVLMADNHERIALISDEGGIFDILAGRYSNGIPNLDLFLQSHSGSPVRVDRAGRPAVIMEQPALTMVLSPQPDLLSGLAAKPGFRGRGLLARFLYALAVSTLGQRTGSSSVVSDRVAADYAAGIHALLRLPVEGGPLPIELESDAHEEWLEFFREVEIQLRDGGRFEHMHDWAGKLPGAAARIAGILHCAKHAFGDPRAAKVDLTTMTEALDFAAPLADHALAVFDLMGADPALKAARKLWSWVRRERKTKLTFRDAHRALHGSFPRAADLEPAFEVLEERAHLRETTAPQSRPGPRSRTYEINPALTGQWRQT